MKFPKITTPGWLQRPAPDRLPRAPEARAKWLERPAPDRVRSVPLLLLFLFPGFLQAAEPADPSVKLREQLRTVMLQVRTAQADAANAQVAKAAAEQKSAGLETKLAELEKRNAALVKQANADKAAADESLAKLHATLAARDQQLGQTQQALQKWQEGYQKAVAAANAGQQQATDLQAQLTATKNTLADRERKNLALFNTANEILDRYQNYAMGKSLLAREPFIGTTRVKIENLVQGYKDSILDHRLNAPAKKAAENAQ